MNQKPIFILGAHKSGTSLLRSLLDGHSHLFAVPIEAHYFQNMRYWVDNEYRKQRPKHQTRQEIIENFTSWIKFYNNLENPYADAVVKGFFNEEDFHSSFSQLKENDDDKRRIELYFRSIFYSINKEYPSEKVRFVEKSVENAEFAFDYQHYFPDAKFIHIIRNPFANIVSLRKYKMTNGNSYPLIHRLVNTFYNNYYFLYKNKRIINNYLVIKYEDLVTNPDKIMKEVSKFLNIPFESALTKPSLLGKSWEGNSTSGNKFKEVSASTLDKWKNEIHPMEIFYIKELFSFVLEQYAYTDPPLKNGFWKPAKGESFKKYFANRFFKYFAK